MSNMQKEVNKLLKQAYAQKLAHNHKACIEIYNMIGGLYSDVGDYDQAIENHKKALDMAKTIGDRLSTAAGFRFIGENYADSGDFTKAIDYTRRYQELTQRIGDQVELQRAWTTLGRVYLTHAQQMRDTRGWQQNRKLIEETSREAERHFKTAYNLAESVRDRVDEKEFTMMKSGLLLNLGIVMDLCGRHTDSVMKIHQAIDLYRRSKLKEDLHTAQIVLSGIYRARDNIKMAMKVSSEALQTAKSTGKKLLICEAMIEHGLVQISLRDYKNAKRSFAQAYLQKSPNEFSHQKAERLTKLAHLISTNYDKILSTETSQEDRLKTCDKLGDLFVAIENFKLAVEYYRLALSAAKKCGKPKSDLARILFSIAETFADDGCYEKALICYQKEYSLRESNDKEQCQSLIKMANMYELLNRDPKDTYTLYERAYEKAGKSPVLKYNVLKNYVPYYKKTSPRAEPPKRLVELADELLNLKSYEEVVREIEHEDDEDTSEPLEDDIAKVEDVITDDEDNDEVLMVGRRRRTPGGRKFKHDELGNSPLHQACIQGDLRRVRSLIAQGHEVNPRDNAGWLPIHEAANYGHYEIVEYLIECGADINHRGCGGVTPLHDAAWNGHINIMKLLIEKGANVIALTDTTETVLACLRQYKREHLKSLHNREISDLQEMETELQHLMDQCGFDLIEERSKTLPSASSARPSQNAPLVSDPRATNSMRHRPPSVDYTRTSRPGTSSLSDNTSVHFSTRASRTEPALSKSPVPQKGSPDPRSRNRCDFGVSQVPGAVREYRQVIGTLKRKYGNSGAHSIDEDDRQRADLPAVYETVSNTSAPTKEWLIDDVSRSSKSAMRRNILDKYFDEDSEEETGEPFEDKREKSAVQRPEEPVILDEGSIDTDLEILSVKSSRQPPPRDHSPAVTLDDLRDTQSSDPFVASDGPPSVVSSNSTAPNLNPLQKPILVLIEGRRLLVPVRDQFASIRWLKEAVIERYATVAGVKPNVKLTPATDCACELFDNDLCTEVLRDPNVLAHVESWQLDSIEETYLNECKVNNIKPKDYIRRELARLESGSSYNKFDWSHTRLPSSHVKPVARALAFREFAGANLCGATSLLETATRGREIIDTIFTWRRLTHLTLSCVGMQRCHLEMIIGDRTASIQPTGGANEATAAAVLHRLPELRSLDLRHNSIAYKCKVEFKIHIEALLCESLPKLRTLDLRGNHLHFVRSICALRCAEREKNQPPEQRQQQPVPSEQTSTVGQSAKQAADGKRDDSEKPARAVGAGRNHDGDDSRLDLAAELLADLPAVRRAIPVQLLCADQKNYCVFQNE